MSYKQAAVELQAKVKASLGDKFSIISGDMERVRSSDVLDHALKVGDAAPEFTLPDASGHEVSLKSLLAEGPLVISFYRGEWCPYCNIELRELQAALPKMQALGAKLVAISPEKPDSGIIATEKNKLTYPILSDFNNTLARQFGIVFQVGDGVCQDRRPCRHNFPHKGKTNQRASAGLEATAPLERHAGSCGSTVPKSPIPSLT